MRVVDTIRALSDHDLARTSVQWQQEASALQRLASAKQRQADRARKEIKRRKRQGEADGAG